MLRKILAVDDSALIHQMYKLFLSRYKSCKLISAMNGLEALDKLGQEEGIDLILLDINMPVMNGLEFLQRVLETFRRDLGFLSHPGRIIRRGASNTNFRRRSVSAVTRAPRCRAAGRRGVPTRAA